MLSLWKPGAGPPLSSSFCLSPSTFHCRPAPAQEQNSAPVEVAKKVPISMSALVSSVDFTENVAKSLHRLHSRQLKSPLIFLISVVPPQCHHWLPSHCSPMQPPPTGAHPSAAHHCLQVVALLTQQHHSPLQGPYKCIKECDVVALHLVVYPFLHQGSQDLESLKDIH